MNRRSPTPSVAHQHVNDPTGHMLAAPTQVQNELLQKEDATMPPPSLSSLYSNFITILLTIIKDNTSSIRRLRTDCITVLVEKAPFVCCVLAFYALTLCGASPAVCEETWTIEMPLKSISIKGPRCTLFQYFWLYMCMSHLHQALIYGLPWTFRDAKLLTNAQMNPKMSIWQRNALYASNFLELGLGLVAQPLMFFLVSRELGRTGWRGLSNPEVSVYAGLLLHAIRIFLETLEQLAYDKGWINCRLTIFVMMALTLLTYNERDYMNLAGIVFQQSWDAAKEYNNLGNSVRKVAATGTSCQPGCHN